MTLSPPRRPDESMTLITSMLDRPLDPGYAAAADRRAAAGRPRATSSRSPALFLACLLVGLLLATAALTLRAGASPLSRVRTDLIARIEQRRAESEKTSRAITSTESEIARLERAALDDVQQRDVADRVSLLRQALGADPVRGPGLVVTLDNAPDADETTAAGHGRVLSRDIVTVVNALWAAGAEAIAVNDQRLSAARRSGSPVMRSSSTSARSSRPIASGPSGIPVSCRWRSRKGRARPTSNRSTTTSASSPRWKPPTVSICRTPPA